MAQIKTFVTPTLLYRYRSVGNIAQEAGAIQDQYIYAASYEKMNDPMEGVYEATDKTIRRNEWKYLPHFISRQKGKLGIASFCETHLNHLMWAHYAGGFTGICIAYDFARLRDCLPGDVEFVRVAYSDRLPEVTVTTTDDAEKATAKAILSTKSLSWVYEREWRLFAPKLGPQSYKADDTKRTRPVATAVYLGSRITEPAKKQILQAAKSKGLKAYKLVVDGYALSAKAVPVV